jgi:hypothetical protein
MYKYIVNPKTGRKVKITSKLGKQIFKQYMKQSGGSPPSWFPEFLSHLENISSIVSSEYPNYVITGSGALVLILHHLERYDLMEGLVRPSDIDFIVTSDIKEIRRRTMGRFSRKQERAERSVTYQDNEGNDVFDITIVPKINRWLELNDLRVLPINTLLSYYIEDERGVDEPKISVLREIDASDIPIHELPKTPSRFSRMRRSRLSFDSPEGSPARGGLSFDSPPRRGRLSWD